MSDTVVEKKGFGTRIKNSFSGIFAGILLVIIGIGVLIFNEKSNVVNIRNIKELRDNYTDVSSEKVSSEYDGKLIVTSGILDFGDKELVDPIFNVTIKTPLLMRKVEMYQWDEESRDNDNTTEYTYKKDWVVGVVDSSNFKYKSGHENPTSIPYDNERYAVDELKVGVYKLSSSFNSLLNTNQTYNDFTNATIPEGYKVYKNYLIKSANPDNPQIGDVRISFVYAYYKDVTVLGKLNNDVITEYVTKENTEIKDFAIGTHNGDYIITQMEKSNKIFKWVLRLIGTVLIIGGIKAFFGPLTTLTSYVPIFGNLVNGATGLISTFIGLAISLIVIAISWIVFRPVLGIGLLVGAVILIVLAIILGKKKSNSSTQQTNNQQINN